MKISKAAIKGYVAISGFMQCILGMISIYMGINYEILINTNTSWLVSYYDILKHKIGIAVFGLLMIVLGCAGLSGVLANKRRMLFLYNIGLMILFLCSIGLLIPLIIDYEKPIGNCSSNSRFQANENMSLLVQSGGLCTSTCDCQINSNMVSLYDPNAITSMVYSNNQGYTQAISCFSSNTANQIQAEKAYTDMQQLESYFSCQGMCTFYKIPVFQFTDISRGPPVNKTCFDQLTDELSFILLKIMAILVTVVIILSFSLFIAYLQYNIKQNQSKQPLPFYDKLASL